MAPGAELRVATDIPDYADARPRGRSRRRRASARCTSDPAAPWPDWPGTRYEAKALRAGRSPQYLTFRRDA